MSKKSEQFIARLKLFRTQNAVMNKLMASKRRERIAGGRAVSHIIRGAVECVPAFVGRPAGYKNEEQTLCRTSLLPSVQENNPSLPPLQPQSSAMASRLITDTIKAGQGSHLPHGEGFTSTPSSSAIHSLPKKNNNMGKLLVLGMDFGQELSEAAGFVDGYPAAKMHFLEKLDNFLVDEEGDNETLIDLHEKVIDGELDENSANEYLSAIPKYVRLLHDTLTELPQQNLAKDLKLRMYNAVRPGGRLVTGLKRLENETKKMQLNRQAASKEAAEPRKGEKSKKDPSLDISWCTDDSIEEGGCGPKRTLSSAFPDDSDSDGESCLRSPNKTARYGQPASTEMVVVTTKGDKVCVEDVVQPDTGMKEQMGDDQPHGGMKNKKNGGELNKSTHDRISNKMTEYANRIVGASVRLAEIDSDHEDSSPVPSDRFAMGDGKSMTLGPIHPNTSNYIVVGVVPLDDKHAADVDRKFKAAAKALRDGEKSSKSYSVFGQKEVQMNFQPGAMAFSLAVRHKDPESQKVLDPLRTDGSTIEYKYVQPASDHQFRFTAWFNFIGKSVFVIHSIPSHPIHSTQSILSNPSYPIHLPNPIPSNPSL